MSEGGREVSLTGRDELSIHQGTGFMSNDVAIEDGRAARRRDG